MLRRHATTLRRALGSRMVGYYLHGSVAVGDFDMTSDVDFTVVIQAELSSSEVTAVQAIHAQTYAQDSRWAKRLEYSFFPMARIQEPSSLFPKGTGAHQLRR